MRTSWTLGAKVAPSWGNRTSWALVAQYILHFICSSRKKNRIRLHLMLLRWNPPCKLNNCCSLSKRRSLVSKSCTCLLLAKRTQHYKGGKHHHSLRCQLGTCLPCRYYGLLHHFRRNGFRCKCMSHFPKPSKRQLPPVKVPLRSHHQSICLDRNKLGHLLDMLCKCASAPPSAAHYRNVAHNLSNRLAHGPQCSYTAFV